MIIEPKFTHGGNNVAHIEDVVIKTQYRHKGIARSLINELVKVAEINNCYKAILDCTEDNVAFYEKCGFARCEFQMRKNLGNIN